MLLQEQPAPHESLPALRARTALLLEFAAALERILHAAFEGGLDRRPPPAAAGAFFVQNRKVVLLPAAPCDRLSCGSVANGAQFVQIGSVSSGLCCCKFRAETQLNWVCTLAPAPSHLKSSSTFQEV